MIADAKFFHRNSLYNGIFVYDRQYRIDQDYIRHKTEQQLTVEMLLQVTSKVSNLTTIYPITLVINHIEEKIIYDPMPELPVCKEDEKYDYDLEICVIISVPSEEPGRIDIGYASDVVLATDEKEFNQLKNCKVLDLCGNYSGPSFIPSKYDADMPDTFVLEGLQKSYVMPKISTLDMYGQLEIEFSSPIVLPDINNFIVRSNDQDLFD